MMTMPRSRTLGRPAWSALPLTATGLAGVTLGAILAGAGYVMEQLTAAPPAARRRHFDFTPWEMGATYEEVQFPAEDGAVLRGWLLTRPESGRAVVGLAGYRGRRPDLLGISSGLWRAGYNVLLFDYRGHGDSDGHRVTLGYAETSDFRAALAWLRARLPGAWLGAIGYSMGGAVALLGAADEPAVRAVVTDCAFCRQEEVIRIEWRRRMGLLPASPVLEVAGHLLSRRLGFHYGDVEPLAAVGRLAPRPLLLIHSGDDRVVPVGDVERLYAAAGEPKELWIVPGEPHCGAYFADRVAYTERVIAFFNRAAERDGAA
jgi:dipeptidyl aminopeptidase/acylaminoacyl peptidase